jgi:hypothetical protein
MLHALLTCAVHVDVRVRRGGRGESLLLNSRAFFSFYRLSTTAGRADVLSDTLSEWATFLPLVSQALLETNVVALDRALNAGQQFLEHALLDMCVELLLPHALLSRVWSQAGHGKLSSQ